MMPDPRNNRIAVLIVILVLSAFVTLSEDETRLQLSCLAQANPQACKQW
jgi:hypothetical protein